MRFLVATALALIAGCSPPVIVESYAWDKDQLILLHSITRPAQVFFRAAGDEGWTATSSSTLEPAPPVSGLWDLEFTDWTVLNLGQGRVQVRQPGKCHNEDWEISRIASRIAVDSCARPTCTCQTSELVLVEPGAECPVPTEWHLNGPLDLCIRIYR